MLKQGAQWSALFGLAILLAVAAARFAYFPGDVALAHLVQALSGETLGWARFLTSTVSAPWNYVLVVSAAGVAWWLAGWRGAAVVVLAFSSLVFAEPYLKAMIGRPRPAATLVRVSGSPSGFSFPSGFGLLYFSLFGTLGRLAWQHWAGRARALLISVCALLLLLGGGARVALGAHWPSDLVGAYLIGAAWVFLLLHVADLSRRRPA